MQGMYSTDAIYFAIIHQAVLDKMRIDRYGSVGIGTTTPDNLLTILGNELTANAILHLNASDNFNTSVKNVLTLDHVLKSPVNSTGGVGVSILFRASDNASQMYKIANISAVLYNATNGSQKGALTFSTSGADTGDGSFGHLTERLRIDGSGNIGIGTTTPAVTLDVKGKANFTGNFSVGQTSNIFFVDNTSGNIGIGTTSPQDKLHVSGFIRTGGVAWNKNYDFGTSPNNVYSLAVYNGSLYAGIGGTDSGDGDIYVYDGITWSVSKDGGASIKTYNALAVYNGKLYAGQGSSLGDGDVLVFSGSTWSTSYNGGGYDIKSLVAYNGKLYAGNDSSILVFDGSTWSTSYSGVVANSFAVYNGKLYAGVGSGGTAGDVLVFDGSTWSTSYDGSQEEFGALAVYNGKLYAGQGQNDNDADIYVYSERLESQLSKEFDAYTTPFGEQYQHFAKDITILGNVGIGTAKPQQKLTLGNASNFTIEMSIPTGFSTALTNATGGLKSGTYRYKITALGGNGETAGSAEISITLNGLGNNASNISWSAVTDAVSYRVYNASSSGGQASYFTVTDTNFTHTNQAFSGKTGVPNATTAYVVKLSSVGNSWLLGGNVGIGTTSPQYLLQVANATNAVNLSGIVYINGSSGNIGIGTTSPQTKLQIDGINSTLRFYPTSGTPALFGDIKHTNTNGFIINAAAGGTSAQLSLQTEGVDRLFITYNGNIGIGTTTPSSTLEVTGNFTVTGKTNSTIGNFSIIQYNSTCAGFRFNNSLNAGGIFSCMA